MKFVENFSYQLVGKERITPIITRTPGICRGSSVIQGERTSIPIINILTDLRLRSSRVGEMIRRHCPYISNEEIDSALAYVIRCVDRRKIVAWIIKCGSSYEDEKNPNCWSFHQKHATRFYYYDEALKYLEGIRVTNPESRIVVLIAKRS